LVSFGFPLSQVELISIFSKILPSKKQVTLHTKCQTTCTEIFVVEATMMGFFTSGGALARMVGNAKKERKKNLQSKKKTDPLFQNNKGPMWSGFVYQKLEAGPVFFVLASLIAVDGVFMILVYQLTLRQHLKKEIVTEINTWKEKEINREK
jgi:hypothetical protein